jgi:hypothetical protein
MNKIIEVALAGKFTPDAVPSIMDVIIATPNPEMATEILLGIYEKPALAENVIVKDVVYKLDSVDYWNNEVRYTYLEEGTKSFYVQSECNTDEITMENYETHVVKYYDGCKYFTLKTGEMVVRRNSCSIGEWLNWESENLKKGE